MTRDEAYESVHHRRTMPFITAPTQPPTLHGTDKTSSQPPTVTPRAKEPETSSFVLGLDTCGFASSSTLTCDYGYECRNVDSYRGCCKTDLEDCSSSIYTQCVDYADMPDAGMCGPQTLCCPSSKNYCLTYTLMAPNQPSLTLTHVGCAETPIFGELLPSPPTLGTITDDQSLVDISTQTAQSEDHSSSSSSGTISAGAIAGVVVGAVVFLLLLSVGIAFLIHRRRHPREGHSDGCGAGVSSGQSNGKDGRRRRPLSTVHEEPIPCSTPLVPPDNLARPVAAVSQHGSCCHSPRNPLSAHPVSRLEKRVNSLHDIPPRPAPSSPARNSLPINQSATLPPQWTRIALPPPPSPKNQKRPKSVRSGSLTGSIGSALQSPRQSNIPPAAIDDAFNEEVSRPTNITFNEISFPVPRTSSSDALRPVSRSRSQRSASHSNHAGTPRSMSRSEAPAPAPASHRMSWLDDDDDDVLGTQRFSMISVPGRESFPPVSPLSPGDDEGRGSPMTVSPLTSRRGSYFDD
ncbi:hypothetical protein GGS21DRAFT_77999 [Xylaria nigripes]|nr:hypothetical protein GGS21DRAFT_77999 [Xylaria nigripes]